MLSSDYLLQGFGGIFTKAAKQIDDIRNKYTKEINDSNLGDIKNFVNTDLYNKMINEIRAEINKSYGNK